MQFDCVLKMNACPKVEVFKKKTMIFQHLLASSEPHPNYRVLDLRRQKEMRTNMCCEHVLIISLALEVRRAQAIIV